ncbi:MAG TPA: sigma-70 family RNA polymerase sigma factor [Pirellulaceae bacterium]|nr:sigma-70 family RNA polymerase sigma factor [Pirellulaceae bacterium]
MSADSTAEIFERFREGDSLAADEIFARYVDRLTRLARTRLTPKLATRTDAEDIVMSAYRSFFIRTRDGQFTLQRSGDLWRLLVSITMNKLHRQVRHHQANKRSVAAEASDIQSDQLLDREPRPEEVVEIADQLEFLMAQLEPFARRVLELRLQEEDLAAIASETGRSERTVRRTLADIREKFRRRLERVDAT